MSLYKQDACIVVQPHARQPCRLPCTWPAQHVCRYIPWLFRDHVDEERAEKQVAAIMQKTLDQQDSHGRKFFYAISRSDCISLQTSQCGSHDVHAYLGPQTSVCCKK